MIRPLFLNRLGPALLLVSALLGSAPARGDAGSWERLRSGAHSIREKLVEGTHFKRIPVRNQSGKVLIFNFALAKELGLIPVDAPNELSPELMEKILATFSIQVAKDARGTTGDRIATFYSDGGLDYDSGKGDGRSLWVGEVQPAITDGKSAAIYDITLKGSGDTGLGFDYPGHRDGLTHASDSLQEYYAGELLHRNGISDSSRVLAVILTENQRTLSDGKTVVPAAITVRVSPENLRFAHLWRHREDSAALRKLLEYHFSRDAEYRDLGFDQAVRKLVVENAKSSASEMAVFENFQISQLSPTRGNRLIGGKLIDFGTLQAFDAHYRDLFLDRELGTVSGQKDFSVHWNRKLKEILSRLTDLSDIDMDRLFEDEFRATEIRLNLYRLGLDWSQIARLKEARPELATRLSSALVALRDLSTLNPVQLGKKKLRMPVIDFRAFVSQLPMKEILAGDQFRAPDEFLRAFGTPHSKLPFERTRLTGILADLNDGLRELAGALSTESHATPEDVASALERSAAQRSFRPRKPGLEPRVDRMKNYETVVRGGADPAGLARKLEEEISEVVDFEASPGLRSPNLRSSTWSYYRERIASDPGNPGALASVPRGYSDLISSRPQLRDLFGDVDAATRKTIDAEIALKPVDFKLPAGLNAAARAAQEAASPRPIATPAWLADFISRHPVFVDALGPSASKELTTESMDHLLTLVGMSTFDTDLHGLVGVMIQFAKTRRTLEERCRVVFDILSKFGAEIDWSRTAQTPARIAQMLENRDRLPVLLEKEVLPGNQRIRLVLRGDKSKGLVSMQGFDARGARVFVDGPRSIYRQSRSQRVALSPSSLWTDTASEAKNQGIYREALFFYMSAFPEIEVLSLGSENYETMDYATRIFDRISTSQERERLLRSPAISHYLKANGVPLSDFEKGAPEAVELAKQLLVFPSLQGRARLHAGFSFEPDAHYPSLFWSNRLPSERRIQIERTMAELERGISREMRSDLRHLHDSLFPESYLAHISRLPAKGCGTKVREKLIESLKSAENLISEGPPHALLLGMPLLAFARPSLSRTRGLGLLPGLGNVQRGF